MNENVNTKKKKYILPTENQGTMALLKKLQYKLDSMEKKIDFLIQESKQKTFKDKHFSKPHREYDGPKHHKRRKYEGEKDGSSSERKFYDGHPFDKNKNSGQDNFRKNKKPFNKSSK